MQTAIVVLSDVINHVVPRVSNRSAHARRALHAGARSLEAFCFRHVSGIKSREIWGARIDVSNVVPAWQWQCLAHAHTNFRCARSVLSFSLVTLVVINLASTCVVPVCVCATHLWFSTLLQSLNHISNSFTFSSFTEQQTLLALGYFILKPDRFFFIITALCIRPSVCLFVGPSVSYVDVPWAYRLD